MRGHTGISHNNPGHHCDLKMLKYLILAMMLTGCATVDQMVCYGTGTCGRTGVYASTATVSAATITNPGLPQTIVTGNGSLLIVPNYSQPTNSLPAAILPVSR
jgi:hypothetical protein